MLNIVLVEDHDALREVTEDYLRQQGHEVIGVESAEMLDSLQGTKQIVDLFILDINLPGEDGLHLARRLRAAQPNVGIIMLTANNKEEDKIRGYEKGADIYLTKPTSVSELNAAIMALTRRLRPATVGVSALRLDLRMQRLIGPLASVHLSGAETAILGAMVRARNQQIEVWQLLELQEKDINSSSKASLEVQIVRLRKKLQQAGCSDGRPIKVIRGWGYQLCAELFL